jgi:glutamate racemase
VVRYARSCAKVLTQRGVKALVVACNTASAVALDMLRAELDLPVLGVIDPGARAALQAAQSSPSGAADRGRIGVLGTPGTIASGAYARAVSRLSTRYEVIGQAAPLLVPLVEEGWLQGEVPRLAVERYVGPLVEARVSVIVLGCTHYPVLSDLIQSVASDLAGHSVPVVDSARAAATELFELLESSGRLNREGGVQGSLQLLVTDLPTSFQAMAQRFLGEGPLSASQIDLG